MAKRRFSTPRATTLIVASSIGTYLLILTGVSNALANTANACSGWPLCNGPWFGSPETTLVFGHRIAAFTVGLLLLWTGYIVLTQSHSSKVRFGLGAALLLYPFEVFIGAQAAVSGTTTAISTIHLVFALTIFSALMAALVWQLEAHDSERVVQTDDPNPEPSPDDEDAKPGSAEPKNPGPLTIGRAYLRLTKPYLWWLLGLVALASMGLAAQGIPPFGTALATIAGGVLAIGASGTFNNVLERDRDKLMARTNDRPLVTDIIPPHRAVAFGFLLLGASMAVFLSFVNVLAAGLGLLAVLFYSVVYTVILKPNTDQNTVIGGAVGALPALIGWAAITDSVGMPAIVLGAVVFLWTPAHFYNLALIYKADYARAGFPMLPVVRGEQTTRRHIAAFLGATMLAAVLLGTASGLGPLYATVAVLFGALFLVATVRLHRIQTDLAAKRTFIAANAYLGAVLFAVVIDTMIV
ncbi:heme o synthase [Halodesulfurarchaeum sp.]|uniref:heme o synthase n=1 Tax=Halodesulfurarchaeum sp. TaxID=1980530 RepID=UPI002FC29BE7